MIQKTAEAVQVELADKYRLVPEYMKARPQWVIWGYSNDGKKRKMIYDPNAYWLPIATKDKYGSSIDPKKWATFDKILEVYAEYLANPNKFVTIPLSGIGFALNEECGLIGIDLDDCRSDAGKMSDEALATLDKFNSYAEVTPSGNGVRIFSLGEMKNKTGRNDGAGHEIYCRGRYLTITGETLPAFPKLGPAPEGAVDWFLEKYFPNVADDPVAGDAPEHLDAIQKAGGVRLPERIRQARQWLSSKAGSQQGNNAQGFCFAYAVALVWGYALPEDEATDLLYEWGTKDDNRDAIGGYYPWKLYEIRRKITDATRVAYDGKAGDKINRNAALAQAERDVERLISGSAADNNFDTADDDDSEKSKNDDIGRVSDDDDAGFAEFHAMYERSQARQAAERAAAEAPKKPVDAPEPPKQPKAKKSGPLRSWSELKAIAATQQEDWVIPGWLEFGSLGIFCGAPFSGKSCVVADILAALLNGSEWAGIKIEPVPVLLIDLENKERILVKRLLAAMDGNEGRADELLFAIDRSFLSAENNTLPIGPAAIALLLELVKERYPDLERALIVIDTLRSALPGADSNDEVQMKDALYELQRFAAQRKLAIILLHHHAKHGGYSGSSAIAGAADVLWDWTSDKDTFEGELKLTTRADCLPPKFFRFDKELGRNVYLSDKVVFEDNNPAEEREAELLKALDEAGGEISQPAFFDIVGIKNSGKRSKQYREAASKMEAKEWLITIQKPGKPTEFKLTEAGKAVIKSRNKLFSDIKNENYDD